MAVMGIAVMITGYLISPLLVERDQAIFESLSFDDPNWLYYRDFGDAGTVYGISLWYGGVLIAFSTLSAVIYYFMRRGFTYKLKGNLDRFKLKGSNVG
jgi:hypothetical protein